MPKIRLGNRPEPYKEYQYTAIDDCTRVRFVWVYQELCPANSVDFTRRMLNFFPFPIEEVQTDHGTEFAFTIALGVGIAVMIGSLLVRRA